MYLKPQDSMQPSLFIYKKIVLGGLYAYMFERQRHKPLGKLEKIFHGLRLGVIFFKNKTMQCASEIKWFVCSHPLITREQTQRYMLAMYIAMNITEKDIFKV